MRKIYAVLGIVLVVSMLLTACGQKAPTTTTATTTAPAATTTTTRTTTAATTTTTTAIATTTTTAAPTGPTGSLTIVTASFGPELWLPHLSATAFLDVVDGVYETLIAAKPGGLDLEPRLAEKWESSPDGKTWTFFLRKGIQFQDGNGEFTADDVKFSFDLAVGKDSVHSLAGTLRNSVASVEVVDKYTVKFNMLAPSWSMPYNMFNANPPFPIVSKKYVEAVGIQQAAKRPIGTGPYRFVDSKPGASVTLEAVSQHWRKVPYYKTINYRVVPEKATVLAMLKAGEADIAEVNYTDVADIKKAGLNVISAPDTWGMAHHFGGLYQPGTKGYVATNPWVNADPAKGLLVRKAMNLAVNRQEIVDFIYAGQAKPVSEIFFYPGQAGTDPAIRPTPYDPDQAKKLLAEAGYPNGFTFNLVSADYPGRPGGPQVSEALAGYWTKLGLKVNIQPVDYGVVKSTYFERKWTDHVYMSAYGRYAEPTNVMNNFLSTKEQPNYWTAAAADPLFMKAYTEIDPVKRAQYTREFQKWLNENYMNVATVTASTVFGVSKKVGKWPLPANSGKLGLEYITPF